MSGRDEGRGNGPAVLSERRGARLVPLQVGALGIAHQHEAQAPASREVPAVQKQHVEVNVEVERAAEALNQRHHARLCTRTGVISLVYEVRLDGPLTASYAGTVFYLDRAISRIDRKRGSSRTLSQSLSCSAQSA